MRVLIVLCVGLAALQGRRAGRAASSISESALEPVFKDAQVVDLRTSKVSSVVTLRDVNKDSSPPTTLVFGQDI